MKASLFFVAGSSLVLAINPIVTLPRSRVSYRSVLKDSVQEFHNVKFAHDTSGWGRFAPPRLYSPSSGAEVDATIPGSACPQIRAAIPPFFGETPNQSEDCCM
ncbi:hypothetical protein GGR57DRAFT_484591 [Xylariaceae sp. FL1272]|nr:hypothetical protein GGR57DRAFT_484591 [Xylariaceae sp. FL1272]